MIINGIHATPILLIMGATFAEYGSNKKLLIIVCHTLTCCVWNFGQSLIFILLIRYSKIVVYPGGMFFGGVLGVQVLDRYDGHVRVSSKHSIRYFR